MHSVAHEAAGPVRLSSEGSKAGQVSSSHDNPAYASVKIVDAAAKLDALKIDSNATPPLLTTLEPDTARAKYKFLTGTHRDFEQLVWKEELRPLIDTSRPSDEDVPVIDISRALLEDKLERKKVAQQLVEAGSDLGFFKILNHGVPLELIRKVQELALRFFDLPLEQKDLIAWDPKSVASGGFGTFSNYKGGKNWVEEIYVPWLPEGKRYGWRKPLEKIMPDAYEEFNRVYDEYLASVDRVSMDVLELLGEGLGLPKSGIVNAARSIGHLGFGRLNCYPPCERPDLTLGLGSHSDPAFLTVLMQTDDEPGLQVYKASESKWITVKPTPDTFVVNIGDTLQMLSNDILKSVLHRAVTNRRNTRLSFAYWTAVMPSSDAVFGPAEELVDGKHPAKFKSFPIRDYYRLFGSTLKHNSLMDQFRI